MVSHHHSFVGNSLRDKAATKPQDVDDVLDFSIFQEKSPMTQIREVNHVNLPLDLPILLTGPWIVGQSYGHPACLTGWDWRDILKFGIQWNLSTSVMKLRPSPTQSRWFFVDLRDMTCKKGSDWYQSLVFFVAFIFYSKKLSFLWVISMWSSD